MQREKCHESIYHWKEIHRERKERVRIYSSWHMGSFTGKKFGVVLKGENYNMP